MPEEEHVPRTDLAGRALGNYEILQKIGEGGMGTVYLARDRALDRKVALKILPGPLARDGAWRARFLREARALARLKHPNQVQIYTVDSAGGVHFFAMELIEGESLAERIARAGPLGLEEILSLSGQVLSALSAVHSAGITHRDIKSANIMIEPSGRAVLMDFGLAKEEQSGGVTTAGVILGTPEYMSPEQAESQPATARSDIYSFGIVLYEMVTGSVPFSGKSALAVLRQQVEREAPPLSEKRPDLPPAFAGAVAKALSKSPGGRYGSAVELARALLEVGRTPELAALALGVQTSPGLTERRVFLSGAPTLADTPAPGTGRGKGFSAVLAAAVLATALAGALYALRGRWRPETEREANEEAAPVEPSPPQEGRWGEASVPGEAPFRARLPVIGAIERTPEGPVFVLELEDGGERRVRPPFKLDWSKSKEEEAAGREGETP